MVFCCSRLPLLAQLSELHPAFQATVSVILSHSLLPVHVYCCLHALIVVGFVVLIVLGSEGTARYGS